MLCREETISYMDFRSLHFLNTLVTKPLHLHKGEKNDFISALSTFNVAIDVLLLQSS
jgi:hypothetical protein